MFDHDTWEVLSYVVTVFGLPMAILVFVWEQRRDRQQEEEEIYQQLSDEYTSFMKLVLENADLRLLQRSGPSPILTDEQIAGVLTYIRREWDHAAPPVPVDLVQKIRADTKGRTDAWTEPELLKK